MEEKAIFQANRESTTRLRNIISQISDEEFSISIGSEWTISITLAHLALWDYRVIFVIESAIKNNKVHAPFYDDQLNDILTPSMKAIPPTEAAKMAIATAERVDNALEKCPKILLEEMRKVNSRLLERSIHRNLHLDEIENAITKKGK
jgi:hypothetical protein